MTSMAMVEPIFVAYFLNLTPTTILLHTLHTARFVSRTTRSVYSNHLAANQSANTKSHVHTPLHSATTRGTVSSTSPQRSLTQPSGIQPPGWHRRRSHSYHRQQMATAAV